ncbi:hypothetical protein [Spongiactinospora sp. TRM90649]|uniref:hypothetical protein n=1 Tax=Spongiactinospora sp. TRM90649 TaxID=3031114 RepID=UPI0023F8F06A|nr:hypothetical protein [Spongiactinospora sp. TRM90649]MDF5754894.1 hypothetical protein [Spongiactinospora sp. TRM90649]
MGRGRPVVSLWRWRTEIGLLVLGAVVVAVTVAAVTNGSWWAFAVLSGAVSVPAATRSGRGWVVAHFWCVFSRHRIQAVCLETTMHTTRGRIPLVLWITPTPTGERALILTRAGICAEDFEAFAGELEAACFARRVRVARHRRRANLVSVEIVRRDDALPRDIAGNRWVRVPSSREMEEPPDTRAATLLLPQAG